MSIAQRAQPALAYQLTIAHKGHGGQGGATDQLKDACTIGGVGGGGGGWWVGSCPLSSLRPVTLPLVNCPPASACAAPPNANA